MRVPPEILSSIIDEVALIDYDKMPTLKACALASSQFLHTCRRHIFQSVSLTLNATDAASGDDTPKNLRLYEILEQTPVLAEYIHSLFLKHEVATRSNARNDSRLSQILDKLLNVHFLSVESMHWTGIPPSIQQAIFKLMCSSKLNDVQLNVFNLPQIFVKCQQGIPGVRVRSIRFLPDTNSDSIYEFPPGFQKRLKRLHMPAQLTERSMPLMQLVLSTSYDLETLKLFPVMLLRSDGPGTDVLPIAIAKHGRTLKNLNLSTITSKLDLSNMFALERLALSSNQDLNENGSGVGIEHLTKTLLTASVNNRIRELHISTCDFHILALQEGILTLKDFEPAPSEEENEPVDFNAMGAEHGVPGHRLAASFARYMLPHQHGEGALAHWKRLDDILSGATFSKLEKVNVAFTMCPDHLKGRIVKRFLPSLYGKGNVLSYDDDEYSNIFR